MRTTTLRGTAVTSGLLLTTVLVAGPATASVDPGPTLGRVAPVAVTEKTPTTDYCPLRRVGTQLVRCSDLTGGGATAPSYVLEWR